MNMQLKLACRRLPVAGLALMVGLATVPAIAVAAEAYKLGFAEELLGGELALAIGKNQIINTPVAFDQVVIGNPKVADIRPITNKQVLILGKAPGHTNLVFRGAGQDIIAMMDVMVGYDIVAVKRKLHEVLPAETGIEVRSSNDYIVLSGEVSSAQTMDMALQVVRSFIPDEAQTPQGAQGASGGGSAAVKTTLAKDKVLNLLQVGGGQQVMLEARIAEISRNNLKDVGVGASVSTTADGNTLRIITGGLLGITGLDLTGPLSGAVAGSKALASYANSKGQIDFRALETKGLAKILAEPNLVALSGQEASFLVGGEFPVPVAQSGAAAGAITVEFKEFGVGLKFTPTVLSSKKINLKLGAEVSQIDMTIGAGAATIPGTPITIPGTKTRRASTTVEVADGQSFAIAGLLQNDINNAIDQIPGLGNVPVLGSLFRSTEFKRNETELVIIVTPRLVKPMPAGQLKSPTDNFIPPSDFDQFFMGRLEGEREPPKAKDETAPEAKASTPATQGGGVDGKYGHQL